MPVWAAEHVPLMRATHACHSCVPLTLPPLSYRLMSSSAVSRSSRILPALRIACSQRPTSAASTKPEPSMSAWVMMIDSSLYLRKKEERGEEGSGRGQAGDRPGGAGGQEAQEGHESAGRTQS